MKVMTILGTRPEMIRLSRIIPALDGNCDHVVVHTGQNYDHTLYGVFLQELDMRRPDHVLNCRADTLMGQVAAILKECERVISRERPDRVLILGDTNSALSSIVAKRAGVPVYHMEAGNRCYDDRVPEEVNRRIVDHCSDILMPYTERSRANLLKEGIDGKRIFVTGNPIKEVLDHYSEKIASSTVLTTFGLSRGKYFLVTLHRAENVDVPERLSDFIAAFDLLYREFGVPVVCSLHPRTRSQLQKQGKLLDRDGVRAFDPLGLFDFVHLEQNALCVLSDSGTVQEECCIVRVPTVTLRDVTERPETIEVGSNMLSGAAPQSVLQCVRTVLSQATNWEDIPEYMVSNVTAAVVKIVTGFQWR